LEPISSLQGMTRRWIMLRFAIALVTLAGGLVAWFVGLRPLAGNIWTVGLVIVGGHVVIQTLRGMLHGRFAADIVASMAIVGAFALGQPFAGLMIVVMQTGGEALERHAEGRASQALRELEERAPQSAHRVVGNRTDDVAVGQVAIGDILLVRAGELVPCDGIVVSGESHVNPATLSGEAAPRRASTGTRVMSGSTNLEGPLTIRATSIAAESQYSLIVSLVRTAQETRAPFQRVADRYAVWFTPITIVACLATWVVTRDPVRVLSILVVATPCPLILAAPVAFVAGINRAARSQLIVRHGGALEALSSIDTAVFDKTGTLTIGRPEVVQVVAIPPHERDAMLTLAAAAERGSGHQLAQALVAAAPGTLPDATGVVETPGAGVIATVDGHSVTVGARAFVESLYAGAAAGFDAIVPTTPGLRAVIAIDGTAAGYVEYADQVRLGMRGVVERLHALGVQHTVLLSGDAMVNVRSVADGLGIKEAHGDLSPGDKVAAVTEMMQAGRRVLMVGDGTNDAPALGTATVGIALASGGSGISTEAADVILLADDPVHIADAVAIGQQTMRIARQSIWGGMGMSMIAMGFAAAGMIAPAVGALVQEAIDVAVIVNALRARHGE